MPDEDEYTEELLEVMVNSEGEQPYGPVVNYNGQPINKNSAHNFLFNPDKKQFQNGALKATNYKRNDFRDKSNMREEEIVTMTEKARMIKHVYDNTRAYGTQGIKMKIEKIMLYQMNSLKTLMSMIQAVLYHKYL